MAKKTALIAVIAVEDFAKQLAKDMEWFKKNKEDFTVEMVIETIKKTTDEYVELLVKN